MGLVACGMGNPPGPGITPMSPQFAGRFFTSGLPGMSCHKPLTFKIKEKRNIWNKFSSVTQSCPTLCDPMDYSTPGLPVHHQLPEFTQAHVHRDSDTIQLSHPLPSPSPPAFNLSQHQGLFQWVNFLHEVAKGLEFQLQYQFFQWIFRIHFLQDSLVGLPCSPGNLKSLLQHHSSKASIIWLSAFFIFQL